MSQISHASQKPRQHINFNNPPRPHPLKYQTTNMYLGSKTYKSNKRSCCSRYSTVVTRGIIFMHRMIASGLRTFQIKQKRMTVFFLSVASLLFQYCFTRRLRLFEFQQAKFRSPLRLLRRRESEEYHRVRVCVSEFVSVGNYSS